MDVYSILGEGLVVMGRFPSFLDHLDIIIFSAASVNAVGRIDLSFVYHSLPSYSKTSTSFCLYFCTQFSILSLSLHSKTSTSFCLLLHIIFDSFHSLTVNLIQYFLLSLFAVGIFVGKMMEEKRRQKEKKGKEEKVGV